MSSSYALDSGKSCRQRFQCQEPLYQNSQYCVLHLPRADKTVDFEKALNERLRNYNFDLRGVWFPAKANFHNFRFTEEVNLKEATFNGDVDFSLATFLAEATLSYVTFSATVDFRATTFEQPVTFRGATFKGDVSFNTALFMKRVNLKSRFEARADFSQTEFRDLTEFTNAIFTKEANFYKARFNSITRFDEASFRQRTNFDEVFFLGRVNFNAAKFADEVNYQGALFADRALFDSVKFERQVSFYLANFKDSVRFKGDKVFLPESPPNFRETKFDHPELVSFHSLDLRPFWFVEVDVTKFTLTNVEWDWKAIAIDQEINGIKQHYKTLDSKDDAHSLLRIACWNLAVNAEENHRYEEASKFRYLAMELRRRQAFEASWIGFLHWLYWLMSGYGERIVRALLVLIGIWVLFGAIYAGLLRDHVSGDRLGFRRGFSYSAEVLTLQKPEPHPAPGIAQAFVTAEIILGPVQAALLALAIRRKFSRKPHPLQSPHRRLPSPQ